MMSARFVSWIRHHGRSAAIAEELDINPSFVTGGKGSAPARYIRATLETRALLRKGGGRASHVILMLPPFPALLAVASSGRNLRIAGDLHSGVFNDRKWSWALRPTLAILRKRGIAIVTNESLARVCRAHKVETIVLHDIIEDFNDELPPPPLGLASFSYVLFPVTYAADEPIDAVLEAASDLPDQTFVLTGRAPEHLRAEAPRNVVFTGFVSQPDFHALLRNAGAVAALTTREDTMQRAGYEAISAGVPLVVSSTAVLREYFGAAAAYADANAGSLREAIGVAMRDRNEWIQRLGALKEIRQREQTGALGSLRDWLAG